jgi:hypothetical protein
MSRKARPSGLDYLPLAAIAAISAVATGLGLGALSTPANFGPRLASVDQKADQVRRWTAVKASAIEFPQGAVCSGGGAKQEDLLRAHVANQAQAGKLTLSSLEVGPDKAAPLGQILIPLRLSFQVQGSYDAILGLMSELSSVRPLVFADTVDLVSHTTSVTLKFRGRVFCSA